MKAENPFDKHLEANKGIPTEIREASTFVNDTMEIAWLSAQSVFEGKATVSSALEIYDRIVQRVQQNAG